MTLIKNTAIDIKTLSDEQVSDLAVEIRESIIETVSKNGGHLSSNLGIIETTIALHKCFDFNKDKIIFDVGHQCYAHKILTGRKDNFCTLRKFGGISGFPNKEESEYDTFNEGHCGTAISTALGLAEGYKRSGEDKYVIAVVGDGAFTNGLVYEALNNCAHKKLNLIILLNDNGMSISKNVGGIHNYLTKIRVGRKYVAIKHSFIGFKKIPIIGKYIYKFNSAIKNGIKKILLKNNYFECLGIPYLGPVEGHNIKSLCVAINEAKAKKEICILHVKTKKGKGYKFAEQNPDKYHSIGKFEIQTGETKNLDENFSEEFGKIIVEQSKNDQKICAITAAMCEGTGLTEFARQFPDRFFDVGIAEEHAITFSAGLAAAGFKPVCVLYSTFAQRTFDQVFHDVSIQNLPLTLMLDRCGIVAGDGITHQGILDYSIFSTLQNVSIYAPETYEELKRCFIKSINGNGINIIRYPKGKENEFDGNSFIKGREIYVTDNYKNARIFIICYGKMSELARKLKDDINNNKVALIKLVKIFPVDITEILEYTESAEGFFVIDEMMKTGGVGEKFISALVDVGVNKKTVIHALDSYVPHGELKDLYMKFGFDVPSLKQELLRNFNL